VVLFLFPNGKTVYLNQKHDGPWMKVGLFFNPQLVKKVNLNKKTPWNFYHAKLLLVFNYAFGPDYFSCKLLVL